MALTLTALTSGAVNPVPVNYHDTASLTPAADSKVYLALYLRSTDLATVAAETWNIDGCATTWTEKQSIDYDASTRMKAALFEGVGPFTSEAVRLQFTSGRDVDRVGYVVLQAAADGVPTMVQSTETTVTSTTCSMTLAAFADAGNYTVVVGLTDSATTTFTAEANYETPLVHTTQLFALHKTSSDTSPSFTMTSVEVAAFAFELEEAALGPTIDTQPTAQTAVVNTPAFNPLTFTVAATTSGGTLVYDWELEDGVASGVYANLANGSGATWTGQTAASCTCTVTATTLTGRRIRCNVTDDNGTTTTDAVALTIKTGPVLVQPSVTNASGVTTGTVKSDFPLDASPATAGSVLQLTATAGGVSESICVMPETP